MKAYIFPDQCPQFTSMGIELYENFSLAKKRFEQANKLLGFDISSIMFDGSKEDLQQTSVTQPAVFLHSVMLSEIMGEDFQPKMVAGHSLGEFSALTAAGALSFEDGLQLVSQRAKAMQKACDEVPGTMAAVLGLEDAQVEDVCTSITGTVVAANYNCPGQLVISGELAAVEAACESLKEAGARRALVLPVGGAFHSPLMEPARQELAEAIQSTTFYDPSCRIYQNVTGQAVMEKEVIKNNLIAQLTAPVRWTQSVQQMIYDGATSFTEVGPGKVLQGLVRKINGEASVSSAEV